LKSKWLILFSALLLPAVVCADNSLVEKWLQKMHKAAHMMNYDGKFIYQQDKELSLMRIIHAVDKEGEYERLISLDDVGREVIRSKGMVTCILPDSKTVVVEKGRPAQQFPPAFPMRIEHLENQYRFILEHKERIAGRVAQKIVIAPVDRYRYGHRLWVDNDTGLLLKTHLMDEKGKLLEQFMFTEITFLDAVPEQLLKPQIAGKQYTWYEAKQDKNNPKETRMENGWKVIKLPAGFNNDMKRKHYMPNETAVRHMVYSDGLASVSIFIEIHKGNSPNLVGASNMGAVNAFGRVFNKHHITAVGEVPRATVKMMTESIVYQKK